MAKTWNVTVPLIFYVYIEWHRAEICRRQFGVRQEIVGRPDSHDYYHSLHLKGRTPAEGPKNWAVEHSFYIMRWNSRAMDRDLQPWDLQSWEAYIGWFSTRSRLLLQSVVPPEAREASHFQPPANVVNFLDENWGMFAGWNQRLSQHEPTAREEYDRIVEAADQTGVILRRSASPPSQRARATGNDKCISCMVFERFIM